MSSIIRYGKRWTADGPTIVYNITRTFISSDKQSLYKSSRELMAWLSLSSGIADADGGNGTASDK